MQVIRSHENYAKLRRNFTQQKRAHTVTMLYPSLAFGRYFCKETSSQMLGRVLKKSLIYSLQMKKYITISYFWKGVFITKRIKMKQYLLVYINIIHLLLWIRLTHFMSLASFYTLRKILSIFLYLSIPLVFWCFQGVQKETNGIYWLRLILCKDSWYLMSSDNKRSYVLKKTCS